VAAGPEREPVQIDAGLHAGKRAAVPDWPASGRRRIELREITSGASRSDRK
jgi:hypothetical protein